MMKPIRYASGACCRPHSDDRRGEEEGCDRRSDVRDVLHDRARKPDGTRPQLGLRDPDLAGRLDEVIGAGHGSPPVS